MVTFRKVTPRTVQSSQSASANLGSAGDAIRQDFLSRPQYRPGDNVPLNGGRGFSPSTSDFSQYNPRDITNLSPTRYTPSTPPPPSSWTPRNPIPENGFSFTTPTIGAGNYSNPFREGLLNPGFGVSIGENETPLDALKRGTREQLGGLVDDAALDQVMNDTWLEIQKSWALSKAESDTMLRLMADEAALPYDQKLLQLDRSMDDVRGKMSDLDKITDYYKSTLVDTWERAAAAGRMTTGNDIRAQIAPRIAEIGKLYDASNESTQAYLDRIGGVPMAQRIAVSDAISEMQSPYEGLSETEGTWIARIVDKTGIMYEAQAKRGLTAANLEAETNRFVTDALLADALEDLEMAREDEIGMRARAVNNAKQRAAIEYGNTNQLPPADAFKDAALQGILQQIGVDPLDFGSYMETFNGLLYGGLAIFQNLVGTNVDPETGEEIAWPPLRTLGELEAALAAFPQLHEDEDVAVLLNMMAAYERQDSEYKNLVATAGRGTSGLGPGGRGRGSEAPDNIGNRDNPIYLQREAMSHELAGVIESLFDVRVDTGRRPVNAEVSGARSANSDHYSGGAVDIWPTASGGKAEMDRLFEAIWGANPWPEVSFVKWNEDGHRDHMHVSWLLPPDIGGGPYIGDVMPDDNWRAGPVAEPTSSFPTPTQETRDRIASLLKSGGW